jgi:hypothetical protein
MGMSAANTMWWGHATILLAVGISLLATVCLAEAPLTAQIRMDDPPPRPAAIAGHRVFKVFNHWNSRHRRT